MKIVLLCGGSGKRLWPLSNTARAKQFLKLLKNKNIYESMVQRNYRLLSSLGFADDIIISTNQKQKDALISQLGSSIPVVIEPQIRDTYPAIALACTYIKSKLDCSEDEPVAVLPIDSYVEQDFFKIIKNFPEYLKKANANVVLMGKHPDYAADKYGYIIPSSSNENAPYLNVSHFKEKPTTEVASELIQQHALWNCGVFGFQLKYMLDYLSAQNLSTEFDELLAQYQMLPKRSFDHEVLEKEESIIAFKYEGTWKDLGTWESLTEEITDPIIGNGKLIDNCSNVHLINELHLPINVIGLSDAIIAASYDGILIADKKESNKIKPVADAYPDRPMVEEKRWGEYKVLHSMKLTNNSNVLIKHISMLPETNLSYQMHEHRSEIWTIISGEGEFILDDTISKVKPGDVLNIPQNAKHTIKAISQLEFIEIQTGTELIEEDIIRITNTWEEILQRVYKA